MITLLVLAVCLFVLGLLFGKRFGILVFALAAGLVVSQYMAGTLMLVSAPYVKQYTAYVPVVLILLPSLLLLIFAKGRHRRIIARVINALIFAAAGLVFVIASPLTPRSLSGDLPAITNNLGLAITGLIVLATLEIAFGKPSKKKSADEPKK